MYKTPYNSRYWTAPEKRYEVNHEASKTIPSQTMTVKQIMERYARGLPLDSSRDVPLWDSDGDDTSLVPPEWKSMDISERQDWMEKKAAEVKAIREKHAQEMLEEQKKKDKQFYRKEFLREIEERKAMESAAPSAGASSEAKP